MLKPRKSTILLCLMYDIIDIALLYDVIYDVLTRLRFPSVSYWSDRDSCFLLARYQSDVWDILMTGSNRKTNIEHFRPIKSIVKLFNSVNSLYSIGHVAHIKRYVYVGNLKKMAHNFVVL
jgi:hypothetical protein